MRSRRRRRRRAYRSSTFLRFYNGVRPSQAVLVDAASGGPISFWVCRFSAYRVSSIRMRNQGSIKILAVDDHPLIRAGLVSFLATEPGLDVVGEAGKGEGTRERDIDPRPDNGPVGLSMPVMDGLSPTQTIPHEVPDPRGIV